MTEKGVIFDIQHYSLHDGPGIRTVVFLKGCPLKCLWCANPESQKFEPELAVFKKRCKGCLLCKDVCPESAISTGQDGRIIHVAERCTLCGNCVEICPNQARKIYGRQISVDQLTDEIKRAIPFYVRSAGGVTFSGGEPMSQWEFLITSLNATKENYIHTAIETCGYIPDRKQLEKILSFTDLILFDIKHINEKKHSDFTGVSNSLILRNAKIIAESSVEMVVRVPVIPGFNDEREDMKQIGNFVLSLESSINVELLPYHEYGLLKYNSLGKEYGLKNALPITNDRLLEYKSIFELQGLSCCIVG